MYANPAFRTKVNGGKVYILACKVRHPSNAMKNRVCKQPHLYVQKTFPNNIQIGYFTRFLHILGRFFTGYDTRPFLVQVSCWFHTSFMGYETTTVSWHETRPVPWGMKPCRVSYLVSWVVSWVLAHPWFTHCFHAWFHTCWWLWLVLDCGIGAVDGGSIGLAQ